MGLTCMFCGHADALPFVGDALERAVADLINVRAVRMFYIGHHRNFDRMALIVMRKMQKAFPDIAYAVVLAYMQGKVPTFESDTPTMYPEGLELVPRKFAISHRNRWMTANSDIAVAYVNRGYGGAAQTIVYARRCGLEIINLADRQMYEND